jgi:hypothetical protein
VIHLSPQADVNLNKNLILQELTPRLSDSVKVVVDRPVRFGDGAYVEVVRPSA